MDPGHTRARADRVLTALDVVLLPLLWLGSALFLAAYLAVALRRIGYPFELDKMEGGTLDHVVRVLAGLPLYVAPSLDFVPYSYTPLFAWIAAAAATLTGPGFVPLRLVSGLASLGCVALIAGFVQRETRDGLAAALAGGLFLATYPLTGGWFDVGRVDSLFLLLLLGALWLLRGPASLPRRSLAGLLLALAFLAKQTALPLVAPFALYALFESRRGGIAFLLGALVPLALSCAVLDYASGGWFRFYVFTLQSRIPILPWMIPHYLLHDLWSPLAVALLFGAFHVVALAPARRPLDLAFHGLVSGGVLGTIWLARSSFGAYDNVLLPSYAIVAIGFGLGWHSARALLRESAALRPGLACFLSLAAGLQLASLVYDPRRFVPSPADRAAGEQLVALLRDVEGPVLVAHHGALATLAGKPMHAQGVAISDLVLRDRGGRAESALSSELREALREQRWAAVVTDTDWWYDAELAESYVRSGPIFDDPNVFFPITGARSRPELLWTPRR